MSRHPSFPFWGAAANVPGMNSADIPQLVAVSSAHSATDGLSSKQTTILITNDVPGSLAVSDVQGISPIGNSPIIVGPKRFALGEAEEDQRQVVRIPSY
jgi:hypothetical protein